MTPPELYPKTRPTLLVIYDLSFPGCLERCLRELSGWRGPKKLEIFDSQHLTLTLHPGLTAKADLESHSDEDHIA